MDLLQLDFNKVFYSISWDFIYSIMLKMGFGTRMDKAIYLLGAQSKSFIFLNGYLTTSDPIKRFVRQDYTLSPLLFFVATHPLFCILEKYNYPH